jgi:hypothetical protein
MRVKLLSGNQAGQIVDIPCVPILISNGLAELVPDEAPPRAAPAPAPKAPRPALDVIGVPGGKATTETVPPAPQTRSHGKKRR